MTRLLLTGASGFIGRPLANNLLDDFEVITLGRGVADLQVDLVADNNFSDVVSEASAEVLVHSAWTMEPNNYDLPINFDWLRASLLLVEEFVRQGGKTVVAFGSCVQYDWQSGVCSEDYTARRTENSYALTKNLLQDYVSAFCNARNVRWLWLRPFFMYGPREDQRRLVGDIASTLLSSEKATIRNGGIYRDFLHVEDVAGLSAALIRSDASGVFNVGSGEMVSLAHIGELIAKGLNQEHNLALEFPNTSSGKYVVADLNKTVSAVLWQPRFNLESGIQDTLEWWKANV